MLATSAHLQDNSFMLWKCIILLLFYLLQVFSNDMLHRMILSVRVKCTNSGCGCVWTGELINLEVGVLEYCITMKPP